MTRRRFMSSCRCAYKETVLIAANHLAVKEESGIEAPGVFFADTFNEAGPETVPDAMMVSTHRQDCLVVHRLSLTDFRCYRQMRIETDGRPVVLTGVNGAGKTNILEAISLLTPGRGLRRAKLSDIARRPLEYPAESLSDDDPAGDGWAAAAKLSVGGVDLEVGTGCETGGGKRIIKVDGTVVKSQAELGRYTSAQWLTPQMDRLFLEGASGRRRFVDQLIYGLDPEHAGPVAAYDHSMRSRNKLLREGNNDPEWFDSIEDSMARHGVAIAARQAAVNRLNDVSRDGYGAFPGAGIAMSGALEDWLKNEPALAVEDRLRESLQGSRSRDAENGASSFGPHKSDLAVNHGDTGMEAALCSTGEQKALLIGIVLAATRLQTEERGHTPLLLLDEIAAHLDETRRQSLFEIIASIGAQAWMTGTEKSFFEPLGSSAQHFRVADGAVEAD